LAVPTLAGVLPLEVSSCHFSVLTPLLTRALGAERIPLLSEIQNVIAPGPHTGCEAIREGRLGAMMRAAQALDMMRAAVDVLVVVPGLVQSQALAVQNSSEPFFS